MPYRPADRRTAPLSRALAFFLALAALLVFSCSGDGGAETRGGVASPPAAAEATQPSKEIAIAGVMKRVRMRFRPDGDGWAGGQGSYGARVGADGTRFAPRLRAGDGKSFTRSAELVMGPPSVARGGAGGTARQAPIVDRGKDLAIDRGLATEQLENTEQGLEQSFHFDARPAGEGDVTVRVPVSGERYDGATAKGLHFVDDATRLGVRYGAATWVDAKGARTPVALAYDTGAVVLTMPAALVDGSAYPAVLDPVIGPEFGTDNAIDGLPVTAEAEQPAVSAGGGYFLVAWVDYRYNGYASCIYAARVTSAGAVVDTDGIPVLISSKPYFAPTVSAPQVAYDGNGWLVVWNDNRSGHSEVYGGRVTTAGAALDPGGIAIATGSAYTVGSGGRHRAAVGPATTAAPACGEGNCCSTRAPRAASGPARWARGAASRPASTPRARSRSSSAGARRARGPARPGRRAPAGPRRACRRARAARPRRDRAARAPGETGRTQEGTGRGAHSM